MASSVTGMTVAESSALQPAVEQAGARASELQEAQRLLGSVEELLEEGDLELAEQAVREALAIQERALEPGHLDLADTLDRLLAVLNERGHHGVMRPYAERALAIREAALPADDPDLEESITDVAVLRQREGEHESARPLYERALAIAESAFGPDHPRVARALNNLSFLLGRMGDYSTAMSLLQRSIDILERAHGPEHADVAVGLDNMAMLLRSQGQYSRARILLERAKSIWEKTAGPDDPATHANLSILGLVLLSQGDYQAALPNAERSLAYWEQRLGPDHPRVASAIGNLAVVRHELGDQETSRALQERALATLERAYGPDHPAVANSLNNLARTLQSQGDHDGARSLFERAIATWEAALGPTYPRLAVGLANLGALHLADGDLASAREPLDRAISILDSTPGQPQARIKAYSTRARVAMQAGETSAAQRDLEEALAAVEAMRPNVAGGEAARAEFFEQYVDDFDTMVRWQIETGDLERAYEFAERGRSRVLLDQLAAGQVDLRAAIPADVRVDLEARERQIRARLASRQAQLDFLRRSTELSDDELGTAIARLEQELHDADRDYKAIYDEIKNVSPLWRSFVTTAGRPASLSEVQRTLVPEGGWILLYEIGSERSYVLAIPPRGEEVKAFELTADERAAADLGVEPGPLTAAKLDAILSSPDGNDLLEGLSTRGSRRVAGGASSAAVLRALFDSLMPGEQRASLLAATEVVVIPDGALYRLPFEALVVGGGDDLEYWLDAGPVLRYAPSITALRNIVSRPSPRATPRADVATVLSVSDPVYDSPAAPMPSNETIPVSRSVALPGSGASLSRLAGTADETEAITTAFGEAAGDAVETLQRQAATEPAVRRALAGKRLIHLATHGIVDASRGSLFASLALTPPTEFEAASIDDDGHLQLHEIYELPLDEAELAVLSACDSNVGYRVAGEGVFALSRGFLAAGARRVVASQWQVDDASTAALIGAFFERIIAMERSGRGVDYARALWEARQAVRARRQWAAPYFWAPFVLTGAP